MENLPQMHVASLSLQERRNESWPPPPEIVTAIDSHDSIEKIKGLLLSGADPNTKDFDGAPIIYDAVLMGFTEAVELLLRHGAKTDYRDSDGACLLECVVVSANPSLRIVRALLRHGMTVSKSLIHAARTELQFASVKTYLRRHDILQILERWVHEREMARAYQTLRFVR